MTRQEWAHLAREIAKARAEIVASWPQPGPDTNAMVVHHQKLIYFAKLDGFDQAVRATCRVLRSRASRFDPARFMRMIGI